MTSDPIERGMQRVERPQDGRAGRPLILTLLIGLALAITMVAAARRLFNVMFVLANVDLLERCVLLSAASLALLWLWPTGVWRRLDSRARLACATVVAITATLVGLRSLTAPSWPYACLPSLAVAWIGINLGALCLPGSDALEQGSTPYVLGRLRPLFDLVAPLLLWNVRNRRRSFIARALGRLAISLVLACAPAAVLIIAPPGFLSAPEHSPQVANLTPWPAYSMVIDQPRRTLWVTNKEHTLLRLSAPFGQGTVQRIPTPTAELQEVALLPETGAILFVDRDLLDLWIVDSTGLCLSRIGRLAGSAGGSVQPLLPGAAHDLIVASENTGLLAYDLDSAQPRAEYRLPGGTTPATLVDAGRQRVYVTIETLGLLVELDLADLRPLRSLKIGRGLGILCLDTRNNVAWLPMPTRGRVLKIDINAWRVEPGLEAAPGVRVAAVDPGRGLLVCGGFTPYVELFDLQQGKLLTRLRVGPWQRTIDLDLEQGRAYIASGVLGVYSFNYAELARQGDLGLIHEAHPLWPLLRRSGDLLATGLLDTIWEDKRPDD